MEVVNYWKPEELVAFLKQFKSKPFRIQVLIHEGIPIDELMNFYQCTRSYVAQCRRDFKVSYKRSNQKAKEKRLRAKVKVAA